MSGALVLAEPSSWAVLSDCGRYRYVLGRRWAAGPRVLWVMLNPSTADADVDDPTIRRCIAFSRREGFGALEVVNLFAWRATFPIYLTRLNGTIGGTVADPVGPDNNSTIRAAIVRSDRVIAAWGAEPIVRTRQQAVAAMLGGEAFCLGTTQAGHPRHPLYVRGDQPLVRWP